jgi:hypothetical protein
MARSTVHCPHCEKPITVEVGEHSECNECGGALKVHEVGADEENEALKQLLSRVKIVHRVDRPKGESSDEKPRAAAPKAKRPWWKFWG